MTKAKARPWDQLQRRLQGDLYTDILHRVAYSSDASIYRIVPECVVAPRSLEDIQAVLDYASEYEIAVAPRGAGSGIAGESLCDGIVLDLTRYLDHIQVKPGCAQAVCGPGAVLDHLNARLRPHQQKIGPDPSSGNRATIGGCVANNATGSHSLQYGHLAAYVESLETVLADGTIARFHNGMQLRDIQDTRVQALVGQCLDLLSRGHETVAAAQPRTVRNRCGYNVAGVVNEDFIDMARLLVGSEGTLGIFTQITLRTVPVPPAQGLLQLAFDSLEAMGAAVPVIVEQGVTTCELMDRRLLDLARDALPQYRDIFPENVTALLLVEHVGEDQDTVRAAIEKTRQAVGSAAQSAHAVYEAEDQQRLWKSRKDAVPLLYRDRGVRQPVAFIEDVSVPHTDLETYIRGLEAIGRRYDVTLSYFGHAGDGELHVRPHLDLHAAEDVQRMKDMAEEVFSLAWSLGGTISGEHADGLVRTGFIRRQYGEAYYDILRNLKRTFDPRKRLNPGKVISDDPQVMTRHLRRAPGLQQERLETPLQLSSDTLGHELLQCNGCGLCRTEQETLRMCPVFRALGDELGTSRAKVNVLDYWATGQLEEQEFHSPEFRRFLDLCVHCKACQRQCPSGVDVSKLMMAVRARYTRRRGLRPVEHLLSGNRLLSVMGTAFSPIANLGLRFSPVAWMLEKLGGLDRRRSLPHFASSAFLRSARRYLADREPISKPVDRVVYFVDTYANYNDHELGYAVLDVLTANGITVELPVQRPVPLPALCYGDTRRARRDFNAIVDGLKPWAEQGYTIVCSEPSAALALREELAHFVAQADAELIAGHTVHLMDYLWRLYEQGQLRPVQESLRGPYAYHHPCHAGALEPQSSTLLLLRKWAQVEIADLNAGCCGLSGTYGLQKQHADLSERMGQRLQQALSDLPAIPIVTECASCKMQIEHLSRHVVLHPVKLMAQAYHGEPACA